MQNFDTIKFYKPKYQVRILTATTIFDGHDVSINVIRRVLQDSGVEVIHLGHNRSVREIAFAAIQEDVQGIAISSYQGGHVEFFKYLKDTLTENGGGHIKIFGGGGGVIIPEEIAELVNYGITKIFSPDDGRMLGLHGMINQIIIECDYLTLKFHSKINGKPNSKWSEIATLITSLENSITISEKDLTHSRKNVPIIGITGTGGAGKSSIIDEIVRRILLDFSKKHVAILSIDPSKRKTGGALLADRIRINSLAHSDRVFFRSFATRKQNISLSEAIKPAIKICIKNGYDLIIVETVGIGQSNSEIVDLVDLAIYVMTAEYGAPSQLEKIDMLDFSDIIIINKFDKKGAEESLNEVRKQYRRSRLKFDTEAFPDESIPVYGTVAFQFNDPGINATYFKIVELITEKFPDAGYKSRLQEMLNLPVKSYSKGSLIIPVDRERYLAEIAKTVETYKKNAKEQALLSRIFWQLTETKLTLSKPVKTKTETIVEASDSLNEILDKQIAYYQKKIDKNNLQLLNNWEKLKERYTSEYYHYKVREKEIKVNNYETSLAGTKIPKIALPNFLDWGDRLKWLLLENVPGSFPFTTGIYPFKRVEEETTRMFAGEGGPERTNKRFHFVSKGKTVARLSTAFDSVTLYGEDPAIRPDIFGKIGTSGVSVCTIEDVERLYAGFDLCDEKTSVSMTINGPASIILAFFFNAAIRQQCRKWVVEQGLFTSAEAYIRTGDGRFGFNMLKDDVWNVDSKTKQLVSWVEIRKKVPDKTYLKLKSHALTQVRGTVQADILKENQAQNTCIFSTNFSIKTMGDVQEYFVKNKIRNFYSVSISGYHIAEAGANPITQVAFTLANGFTYLEYYLSRGMKVDEIAKNFSFFFSNGVDIEYSVIGRVARRIWAIALRENYRANKRSQLLKYHVQTSGRSLHAQEVNFNDCRTTLQALLAISDNCNSLHTNAYDEAVTTPTEESVRRAIAIQLIINKEFGLTKNENPTQGAFIIEELTELVEKAILDEFRKIANRGGVLGAMEIGYQRNKIQEESLYYEQRKLSGKLPIIGVNTYLSKNREENVLEINELIRATPEEKQKQITRLKEFKERNKKDSKAALEKLQKQCLENKNMFTQLMETVNYCSLGQISAALYEVGGEYRRNL